MNDCIQLILILIVVLVLFTFVTGAHKGSEHFEQSQCGKRYPKTPNCPTKCPIPEPVYVKEENKMMWKCTK
jgi:hypothetical protein